MCIPPANESPEKHFEQMLKIREQLNPQLRLSMGMSNDFEKALQYQSDMVRVGSLLFS